MPIKIKIETPLYTDSKKINLFEKISGWVASTNKITRIDLLTSTTSEPLILTPRAELKEKGSLQAFKNSKFFESGFQSNLTCENILNGEKNARSL